MAPSPPRPTEPRGPPAALPDGTQKKRKRTAPPPLPAVAGKPALFQRTWPPGDEVRILEALAAHRRAHGGHLPKAAGLFAALDGRLEREGVGPKEIREKQRSLERRYDRDAKKTTPPADEHERWLYFLSRDVWAADDTVPKSPVAAQATSAVRGGTPRKPQPAEATKDAIAAQAKSAGKDAPAPKPRTLDEMRELYPYLVDEAMVLVDPQDLQKLLPSIEDNDAHALDKKIKRARKLLTKAITESARMKNMETPIVFLCQSTKRQPEMPRVDKKDGGDICAQGLARLQQEIVELKQIVMALQNQEKIQSNLHHDNSLVKDMRYESAECGPRSIIAENQIPCNKKIEVPNRLPHGKNKEVTSKYKHEGVLPSNVPRDSLKRQGLIKPPFNTFRGTKRNNDAESRTQSNEGAKEVVLLSTVGRRTPVGKAILKNSSQHTIVGGRKLGMECFKVFLYEVLQRDAPLHHQYGEMKKMSDALKCWIAWPIFLVQDSAIATKVVPHQPTHQGH